MLKIYNCIAYAHDLKLVVLAAIVCVLASFAAINLLHHSRVAAKAMRPVWLGIAAISTGCGIWATHFIAMLAFSPGIASGDREEQRRKIAELMEVVSRADR